MTIEEAIQEALERPCFMGALMYICEWERLRVGKTHGMKITMLRYLVKEVANRYEPT